MPNLSTRDFIYSEKKNKKTKKKKKQRKRRLVIALSPIMTFISCSTSLLPGRLARCYQRLLNHLCKDHVANVELRRLIKAAIKEYDELFTLIRKRKQRWFAHVSRSSGLAKTILQGIVKGKRGRGRQKKRWEENIKSGQELTLPTQLGQLRTTVQGGKGYLPSKVMK